LVPVSFHGNREQKMKNYLNKNAFKGIKSELTVKYGVSKSDEIWKYANSEYAGVCACL
jgi:hypothetical protein